FERASGKANAELVSRSFSQYAAELIYRFGNDENVYIGVRYNQEGREMMIETELDITRFNRAAVWCMTKNILTKVEYVNQKYGRFPTNDLRNGGKFDGAVLEAVISF